ncbi:MAG: type II secretion system protein [bacterium]
MKSGSTLVEVMVSIVILAILALVGGAYLVQSASNVDTQRNRLAALATAHRCLEEWRGTSWGTITNLMPKPRSGVTNYFRRTGLCSWASGSINVTNNNVVMPVTNALSYIDADGGTTSYDCVQVTVSVTYPGKPADTVSLQTLIGSP